ncbi:hypothetical protein [Alicyclobacillus acidoterrestris]|uniref:Uncharacterized protein n=1 Tax=Alicyclobacillus acidoterrestris (strain ATCC 49025 / DSM 3922 / CIP 106132 / NCIMB 13137 / GD3B) TaxID=1356854 RepID=T0CUL6_ALIAG|nr:hypothetical protein [Alicyclobacillus acidoterrestris]EPZ41271.1 hypothetical protein N007_01915 [Alicyclobacillus acidoterrestris ATCC 49025]UNO49019.1 hypothetical protein K1I37_00130 [Alicyclobacillus acidoterrestris]
MQDRADYPVTLKPKDVKNILRIGINQAYDLIREAEAQGWFPVRYVGNAKCIPRDPFFEWFEGRPIADRTKVRKIRPVRPRVVMRFERVSTR